MVNRTPVVERPKFQHAMMATGFAWIQVRNAWRAWYRGYVAEKREQARRQTRGWGP